MALSEAEQKELDALELAELEAIEAQGKTAAKPTIPEPRVTVDPHSELQDYLESAGGYATGVARGASLGTAPLFARGLEAIGLGAEGAPYGKMEAAQRQIAPTASTVGDIAGSLALLPAMPAAPLTALPPGVFGPTLNAAKIAAQHYSKLGALTGGITGASAVGEQALDRPETLTPGGAALTVGVPTAIGAAVPFAGPAIGKGFSKLGGMLRSAGKRSGETVVTGAVPSIAAKLARGAEKGVNPSVPDIAEQAVEKGYMGAFTSPSEMVQRVGAAGEQFGQRIGDIGEQLDVAGVGAINAPRLQLDALEEFGKYAQRPELGGHQSTGSTAMDILRRFKAIGKGPGSFERAQALKDLLREKGWESTGKPREDIGSKLYQRAYGMLSDEMETTVGEGLKKAPNIGVAPGDYELLKKEYGFTKLLTPGFQRLEAKDIAGTPFGLREVMATTAGLATGGPAAAIAAGGAQKAFTRFGPQMLAVGGIKGGEALSKVGAKLQGPTTMSVLQTAGRRGGDYFARLKASLDKSGPAGVAVEHNKLMQTDPEYRKNLKEEQE